MLKGLDNLYMALNEVEAPFMGQPYGPLLLIKKLISLADPDTGLVTDISYTELAVSLTINPSPGRKDSGRPTKETIRNYAKSLERACPDYFKIISIGQKLRFKFSELPQIFKKYFDSKKLNIDRNQSEIIAVIESKRLFAADFDTEVNIELNTADDAVKNNNILKITNKNKLTQTSELTVQKKPIRDDFFPDSKTIEMAKSLGYTKVEDNLEIQAFIKHNKKLNSQWEDFNPVFITWLERDSQYLLKKQKGQKQLGSIHHERNTNQSSLKQTALERISQLHGISIETLWGNQDKGLCAGEFIEGALIHTVGETDINLWGNIY